MGSPYTPVPSAGTWTDVTLPDDGDDKSVASVRVSLEALADKGSRAFDRVSGGAFDTGVEVFWLSGSLLFGDVGSALSWSGSASFLGASFGGPVAFLDDADFTAGNVDVESGVFVSFKSGADVNFKSGANVTFSAGATETHSNTVSFGGNTDLGGPTALSGVQTLSNKMVLSGATAQIVERTLIGNGDGLNANHTGINALSLVDGQNFVTDFGALTGNWTWTFLNTNAVKGSTIKIMNNDHAAHAVSIMQADGIAGIVTLSSTSSDYIGVELVNDGLGNAASSWHVLSASRKP